MNPSSETVTRESRSSIELHRHKDGTYFWSLKIYFGDDEDMSEVISDIQVADLKLRQQYEVQP